MHELSIALSILDIVEEEAQRRGGVPVYSIRLKLGPLSGVVKEALLSAYDLAREGTALAACEMVIQEIPIVAYCPACQSKRPVVSIQELCCAVCGEVTPDILTGRELEVAALEVGQ
jgi:hydrogenase nickel incorporation protein HypA/HybF